jgi:hypothetical protein
MGSVVNAELPLSSDANEAVPNDSDGNGGPMQIRAPKQTRCRSTPTKRQAERLFCFVSQQLLSRCVDFLGLAVGGAHLAKDEPDAIFLVL